MALLIKYTSTCECGEPAISTTLDLTQEPGGEVVIDLDMLGDMTLDCESCGKSFFVPAIDNYIEEIDNGD